MKERSRVLECFSLWPEYRITRYLFIYQIIYPVNTNGYNNNMIASRPPLASPANACKSACSVFNDNNVSLPFIYRLINNNKKSLKKKYHIVRAPVRILCRLIWIILHGPHLTDKVTLNEPIEFHCVTVMGKFDCR